MTVESARFPTILDALVSSVRAVTGYGAPGTRNAIPVYDGPDPTNAADTQLLAIGDDDTEDAQSGFADLEWAAAPYSAPYAAAESGEIACVAVAQSGDTDIAALRGQAFAMYATVATVCRTDPSLGLSNTAGFSTLSCRVTRLDVQQAQTPQGAMCVLSFAVTYTCRS